MLATKKTNQNAQEAKEARSEIKRKVCSVVGGNNPGVHANSRKRNSKKKHIAKLNQLETVPSQTQHTPVTATASRTGPPSSTLPGCYRR
eukprot:1185684-Prorocentrum_minimum.AAC.3